MERVIRRGGVHGALVVILILSIGLASSPSRASESRKFDIPAGPAEIAVQLFARQAHMSLLYEPGSLNHFQTRALRGKYEPIEALRLLLEGSGLDFVLPAPRYISVHPGEKPEPTDEAVAIVATVEITANVSPRTTLSDLPAGVLMSSTNGEELTAQGFTTIPDWARTLTQNQGFGANEATAYFRDAMSNIAYGSGLNLYGIGQRATLILLNGQRLAPSGTIGSYTDISNIPLSAVDHIELISDGASTIHGADAVGGIVNIVLRGNNAKAKTAASVGAPHTLSGSDLSQSFVFGTEGLRSLLGVELYERNGLPAAQRSQATSNLTNLGGSNFNTPYGNPGSLLDSNGNLWGIPPAQDGSHLADMGHLSAPNSYDRFAGSWVLPRQRRINVLFSGTYKPNDELELTLNALGNWRWIKTHDAALTTTLIVPHTNPFYFNPVKDSTSPVEVLYGFGKDLGSIVERATVQSGQATLGARYAFNSSWNLQFTGGYTYENQLDLESNLVNFDQLTKYLDATDPMVTRDNAFNPFGAGSNTLPQTLAQIRTEASANVKSSFTIASLKSVGSVPLFAAGPTTLTTGYDYRRQAFLSVVSPVFSAMDPAVNTDRSRVLNAVYSQLSIPVLAGRFPADIPYELKVAGGARYEHFSDVGGAFTPSLGFSFNTTPGTSVFGTWARMFRPPNLPDLNEANNFAAVIPLQSGTGFTNTLVWGGNNANLRPETAKSWMLGVKFSPTSNPKISVESEYFNIGSFNQILPPQLLSLTVLTDPQYSYLSTRDVTPAALANICSRVQFAGGAGTCQSPSIGAIVDLRLRSAQTVKTDGFDFKGGYRWDVLDGEAAANLQATYILHYKETQAPGDDFISYRNTPHKAVALRLRSVFGWEDGRMSVLPAINFQSGYNDTSFSPSRPVRAWTTWDLVVGYKLRWMDDPQRQSHSEISLRGLNIFNSQPPFINNEQTFMGYDPENGDLLGRQISLRFEHEW